MKEFADRIMQGMLVRVLQVYSLVIKRYLPTPLREEPKGGVDRIVYRALVRSMLVFITIMERSKRVAIHVEDASPEIPKILKRLELLDDLFGQYTSAPSTSSAATVDERKAFVLTQEYLSHRVPPIAGDVRLGLRVGFLLKLARQRPDSSANTVGIDLKRQLGLRACLFKKPDIVHGDYPFSGVPLTRGDVEWLLKTRVGELDLRGADLRMQNLRGLNLRGTRGGLTQDEWFDTIHEQISATVKSGRDADTLPDDLHDLYRKAAVHLEEAFLDGADLEGAILNYAYLDKAFLYGARLQAAELIGASLMDAHLNDADLRGAILYDAHLERALAQAAHLERINLDGAHLEGANFRGIHLEGANLAQANLTGAFLNEAFFDTATVLDNVILGNKKHGFASLGDIHWGDVNLAVVDWKSVDMIGEEWQLYHGKVAYHKKMSKYARDLQKHVARSRQEWRKWDFIALQKRSQIVKAEIQALQKLEESSTESVGVNERWQHVTKEVQFIEEARNAGTELMELDRKIDRIRGSFEAQWWGRRVLYQDAVRANRQLATILRQQGMNEEAARFSYRGQKLQRKMLLRQVATRQISLWYLGLWWKTRNLRVSIRLILREVQHAQTSLRQRLQKWWNRVSPQFLRDIVRWVGSTVVWLRQALPVFISSAFSGLLDLLAGYGYKPGRALVGYLVVIFAFAIGYSVLGHMPFSPDAVVFSVTSFHGRGFAEFLPGMTISVREQIFVVELAAVEAILGLFIEITFIVTFTKRFFER